MPLDVLELREFYHSPLGQQAADILGAVLAENRYQTPVLMVGYGAAAWQAGVKDFGNVIMAMPAQQGVMAWPHDAPNQALLMEEGQMPFADQSFGSIIVIHALEQSLRPHDLMAECARVLRPEGQMVVLVPHRRGLWAQFDHTPVGVGQPYSPRQLR
ncbi:MAG: methyltransferase domain-containing protein, partial [Alphaproteobacteria bacterium]|nr:methyltransferase domain-containing protein [Alphaproteobacteria bacterium]